jgi:hypothetical protein
MISVQFYRLSCPNMFFFIELQDFKSHAMSALPDELGRSPTDAKEENH